MYSDDTQIETDQKSNHPVADFLLELKEVNVWIALQATLDSLDIWLSAVKLYFDGSNIPSAEMYHWLGSPVGLLTFVLGGLCFGGFAFIANYSDPNCSNIADTSWPFIRDCFKGLKWTFKGTRSAFVVAQLLFQQGFSCATPVGIGLGVFSAANRLWNRNMVENRKLMQSENVLFQKNIKNINAGFLKVTESELKTLQTMSGDAIHLKIYVGCILQTPDKKFYYVDSQTNDAQEVVYQVKELASDQEKEIQTLKIDDRHVLLDWETMIPEDGELAKILQKKKAYLANPDNLKTLYDVPQFQDNSYRAYVSAFINGVLNAPYYFLGVLAMVTLPAGLILYAAVAVCSFFMVLNVFAECYQEFDFQRKLRLTECKAKLSMIKRFISLELDENKRLFDKIIQENSPSPKTNSEADIFLKEFVKKLESNFLENLKIGNQSYPFVVDEYQEKKLKEDFRNFSDTEFNLLLSYIKLEQLKNDHEKYKKMLELNMVINKWPLIIQGIKNGLHCYGVFNGLLMTIAALASLSGITFGLPFFAVSIGIGLILVAGGVLYTAYCSNDDMSPSNIVDTIENADDNSLERSEDACQIDSYKKIIESDNDIKPSKNLMISEQCEVPRQFLSGCKKGIKFVQNFFQMFPHLDGSSIEAQCIYGLFALGYAGMFSLKGLRGLMRVESHKESLLVGGFFKKPDEAETFTKQRSSSPINAL